MKLLLKDFQETAARELVDHLRAASRESRRGRLQCVSLSSVTGSGKTVIATAVIEILLQGDATDLAIADATFLWITDQPELNEQTRKKMLAASSVLSAENLINIDSSFDRETLVPGSVHFLNTQKLGKDRELVSRSENRTYTIWETLGNTVDSRPGRFFVILDEAHRGMTEERGGRAEAASIVQKFIKGSASELQPVPIIAGLSATPERFNKLIAGARRTFRPVEVDVEEVRASGLIKDRIVLYHPTQPGAADMTMLREAARALESFTDRWAEYCHRQLEPPVRPLLLVQVKDAAGRGQISQTDIAQCIRAVREELKELALPADAFAHAFQEGKSLSFDSEELRYLAPSDIQEDPTARVVFFKTSLNTGWDCPRAEVMMSFRVAADATYIAQLIGRMVRTPLARRIVENEVLNTVALYLPHYDNAGVTRIVDRLCQPDDEGERLPVEISRSEDLAELHRADGTEPLFAALERIPSYVFPRARKANQVRRLMKLARLLTNDTLHADALAQAKAHLIAVLDTQYTRCRNTSLFKRIVEEKAQIEIAAVSLSVGTDQIEEGEPIKVNIAAENIEDLFETAGRRVNEGLHKEWWRKRAEETPVDLQKAKLEIFALCIDPEVIRAVEQAAQQLTQQWLKAYGAKIRSLDERSRAAYDEVKNLAAEPELSGVVYPVAIQVRHGKTTCEKHLYVNDERLFTADLNHAEQEILRHELATPDIVGWVRNFDRKPWALCVPYLLHGKETPMYPDFLLVRAEGTQLVVDIIDPHWISHEDSPAKAAGLARFAARHAEQFGRIQLIILDGNASKRLELTDELVREKVRGITGHKELRDLFELTAPPDLVSEK